MCDIIRYDNSGVSSYYYDANNQSIDEVYDRAAEMLPKYQGKDVFWQVDIFEDGVYDWPAPHFKLYTYVEPKFSLTCQDKTIDYGQKTKCFVSVIAKEELETVSYDLNIPNFKISDVEYPGHIKSIDGDREYNLRVVENKNLDTGMELMSFYLTGTKNESYTDDIKITSIFYRDAVYEGKYEVLRADLEIVPHGVNNPKTVSNLILILFPILICACSYFLILFEQKKLKVNN